LQFVDLVQFHAVLVMDVCPTSTSLPLVNGTDSMLHGWLVYTERNKDDMLEDGLHVITIEDNGFSLIFDDQ